MSLTKLSTSDDRPYVNQVSSYQQRQRPFPIITDLPKITTKNSKPIPNAQSRSCYAVAKNESVISFEQTPGYQQKIRCETNFRLKAPGYRTPWTPANHAKIPSTKPYCCQNQTPEASATENNHQETICKLWENEIEGLMLWIRQWISVVCMRHAWCGVCVMHACQQLLSTCA